MLIDNIKNYPGVESNGVFSNSADPITTEKGNTVFLLSNYAGLYGVSISATPNHALLLLVTDSYEIAKELASLMAVEQ